MQAVFRRLVQRPLGGGASTYSSSCLRTLYGVSDHLNGTDNRRYSSSLATKAVEHLARKGTGGRSFGNGIAATVFGVTGFLGRYLGQQLAKMGSHVLVPFRGKEDSPKHLNLMGDLGQEEPMQFDPGDDYSIKAVMPKADAVINLELSMRQEILVLMRRITVFLRNLHRWQRNMVAKKKFTQVSCLGSSPHHLFRRGLSSTTGRGAIPPVYTYPEIVEMVMLSVVELFVEEDFYNDEDSVIGGSGFLVDEHTIVTCAHVVVNKEYLRDVSYINSKKEVEVILHNNVRLRGVVSRWDMVKDIAAVKVNLADVAESYSLAKLGMANRVRQGDSVCALGSPCGLINSLTAGVISARRKDVDLKMKDKGREYFQIDCAINKGNCGGPLVNMNGEVIGVVNKFMSEDDEGKRVSGIAFAIPIDTACDVLNLGR